MSVCEFELELIPPETEMQNERERAESNNTCYSSDPTAHTSIEKQPRENNTRGTSLSSGVGRLHR